MSKLRLTVNNREWRALNELYGLPHDIFHMVVCAKAEGRSRWVLEGDYETFDDLWGMIEECINVELVPKKHFLGLLSVATKIEEKIWKRVDLPPPRLARR